MITIDDLKNKIHKNSRLVGLDIGAKRIGVSISDHKRLIATPLTTIDFSNINNLIIKLKKIIEENNIDGIIIGYPLNMDGSLGKATQSIRDKSKLMEKELDLPIALWDERLSTVGAFNLSSQLNINISKKTRDIDKNAAAFILQGAIDYLNN